MGIRRRQRIECKKTSEVTLQGGMNAAAVVRFCCLTGCVGFTALNRQEHCVFPALDSFRAASRYIVAVGIC